LRKEPELMISGMKPIDLTWRAKVEGRSLDEAIYRIRVALG
jgi:hypothetical protein